MNNKNYKPSKEVEDFMLEDLYSHWESYLKYENKDDELIDLKKNIKSCLRRGLSGVEELLDWVRCDFEEVKEDHPCYEDLDNIWDHLNWYKDCFDKIITENHFKELLDIEDKSEEKNMTL